MTAPFEGPPLSLPADSGLVARSVSKDALDRDAKTSADKATIMAAKTTDSQGKGHAAYAERGQVAKPNPQIGLQTQPRGEAGPGLEAHLRNGAGMPIVDDSGVTADVRNTDKATTAPQNRLTNQSQPVKQPTAAPKKSIHHIPRAGM